MTTTTHDLIDLDDAAFAMLDAITAATPDDEPAAAPKYKSAYRGFVADLFADLRVPAPRTDSKVDR